MEITGKIIDILPAQEGEGRNGTWKKQNIIIEYGDKYPKKVCVSLWGELATQEKSVVGKEVETSLNLESQENNGRWYTEVKAWKFKILCLVLFFCLVGCEEKSAYKPFLGEWNNVGTAFYINQWVFTESNDKLHAKLIKQLKADAPPMVLEYAADVDENGNIVIHAELDMKGNVTDDRLFLSGKIYQKNK